MKGKAKRDTLAIIDRAKAFDERARQGLVRGRPPPLSGADRRIAEYAAKQVNDVPTLADLATIGGLWEKVTKASIRRELKKAEYIGWYLHSRMAYHRPDLLDYFVTEARKVGIHLPPQADPIEWLRPALNIFALSAAQIAKIEELYDPPRPDSWLANFRRTPTVEDAGLIAHGLAIDYWPYLDPREIKPTLIRADQIGQKAVTWLGQKLHFYRPDLMPVILQAAMDIGMPIRE